jgi:hypothetical protein
MSVDVEIPKREAFFASRSGVCVYVSVEGRALRVCFESLDGEGKLEGAEPSRRAAKALAAATQAFIACRESLAPLFEQIAEASRTASNTSQPDCSQS